METVYVLVQCDLGSENAIIEEITKIPQVKEVRGTYGIYDIFCKIQAKEKNSVDEIITKKIRKISKIRATITLHSIPSQGGKWLLEKQFNPDLLYNKVVHFYIDRKGYSKDQANAIAQTVVIREVQRRICKNEKCKHFSYDHIRNMETCLVLYCECKKFLSKAI